MYLAPCARSTATRRRSDVERPSSKDTYARDRLRFLERIIYDLIAVVEGMEEELDEDEGYSSGSSTLSELRSRLAGERGTV